MRIQRATWEVLSLGAGGHRAAWGQLNERRVLRLTIEDELGHLGIGEAAPIEGYTGDSIANTIESLDQASALEGASVERPEDVLELLDALGLSPAAAHALDQALLALLARRAERSVASLLTARPRAAIPSHALVSDLDEARRAVGRGVTALKVKLGLAPLNDELERLRRLRDALGPEISLRGDVNGAWTLDEAMKAWPSLRQLGVELIEDPVDAQDLDGLRALRELDGPQVAWDRGCTDRAALQDAIAARAMDVVVLKPMVIGGMLRSRELALQAAAAGLRVMVTTCLESELGRQAALAVARAIPPGALEVCGVDPIASVWPGAETVRGPIPSPIASAAAANPDRVALITETEERSWSELADRAERAAGALRDLGVEPGTVVALEGRPSARWVEALFGIAQLGAIAAPIASSASAETLTRLEARCVISDAPETVAPGPWVTTSLQGMKGHAASPSEGSWFLDRPLVRLMTSGSTGEPTSVTLTTAQVLFGALGSALRLGHAPRDRWLCCLPLHHIGGLAILFRAALYQTSVELHDSFDARRVARALSTETIHMISLVPEMLRRLLEEDPRPSWGALRVALIGGAACPPELERAAREAGVPIATTWGMTETAAQVATTEPGETGARGLPPLAFVRVSDDGEGRLSISGPQAGGRALQTGDAGQIREGRVFVEGRVDGVITSGALRLDPEEIRLALLEERSVREAHVVGRPCPRWGRRPVAALVAETSPAADSSLLASLSERLTKPQIPDAWIWVKDLPRGPMGKVSGARILDWIEQAELGEPGAHLLGNRDRLEALHVYEDVNLASGGPSHPIVGPDDLEREGDAARAERLDRDRDREALAEAHRALEVGVGVDEGHAPALVVEDGSPGRVDRQEHLLEGDVHVLKDTTVERDPSPIDLMETNADLVGESHRTSSSSQSETPGVADASSLEGTR